MKLSSFHFSGKSFRSPPLKLSIWCKIGSRLLDSWCYVEKYQRRRVACYCYHKLKQTNFFKKNFGNCSQVRCFKVRNSTRKTLALQQSPSNDMFKTRASRGNHGKLSQSPRWNMHKLFDCIRTPLGRFLACLIFHKKEIRLRQLHKRTNTGSAPDWFPSKEWDFYFSLC